MSVFSQWQFDLAYNVVRIGAVNNLFDSWISHLKVAASVGSTVNAGRACIFAHIEAKAVMGLPPMLHRLITCDPATNHCLSLAASSLRKKMSASIQQASPRAHG
eukprot:s1178_g10.t1